MEMSPAYMAATAKHLEDNGWKVTRSTEDRVRDGAPVFTAARYRVERGADEVLSFEALTYPDGVHAYYLAIDAWHGVTCTSFPVDSWKHRPDRVEWKFYVHPKTSLGLSFVVQLVAKPPG
ncbi:MAG: hypothetical protein R3B06_10840 [Kofleriaceae bacterium]